jgi:predicted ATPase
VCNYLGEFTAARTYVEKGLALYDRAHPPFCPELLPADELVTLLVHATAPLALLGHIDQALSRLAEALAEARRLSHPLTLALALAFAWIIGWFIGSEPKRLLQCADEAVALSAEHGLGFYRMAALVWRGWCLAALGRAEEGIPILTAGLAGLHEVGFKAWRPGLLTYLADACRMAGQLQLALGHLGRGAAHRGGDAGAADSGRNAAGCAGMSCSP